MKSSPEDLQQVDVPFPDHASVITHGDKTIVSIKKTLAPGVVQEFGFTFIMAKCFLCSHHSKELKVKTETQKGEA